jgi:uncharacterized protein (DUF1499 family)
MVTALVAVTMAAMAITGYRSGDLHFVSALKNFEWAAYTAVAALALSLAGIWLSRPRGRRRGLLSGLLGMALALPLVIFIANFEYAARVYPPINDISTDTEDPPTFWEVPNPVTYPGEHVAALQRQGYPDLGPLELAMDPDRVFALAVSVVREMGWEIVAENAADRQIEAVATSVLFGFKDNVAIRLQEENGHTRVDVRSHSRLGLIDRGVNARRIRTFLETLAQRA